MKVTLIVSLVVILCSCASSDFMEGGEWFGLPPGHPKANTDAWKSCSDSSQCKEWCQAEMGSEQGKPAQGKCYGGRDHQMICFQSVVKGIASGELCE